MLGNMNNSTAYISPAITVQDFLAGGGFLTSTQGSMEIFQGENEDETISLY